MSGNYFYKMDVRRKTNLGIRRSSRVLKIPRREGSSKTVMTLVDPALANPVGAAPGIQYPTLDIDPSVKIEELSKNDPVPMPPPDPTPYGNICDSSDDANEFYQKILEVVTKDAPASLYDCGLRILSRQDLCKLCMMLTGIRRCKLETIIEDPDCCFGNLPEKIQVVKILLVDDDGEAHNMKERFHDAFDSLSSYVCTRYILFETNPGNL